MKVPEVGRNVVPDGWTADGESALPELSPCPHDKRGVGCTGTKPPPYLDMCCCVAKVARLNVHPFTENYITGEIKKHKNFHALLATLSLLQKCSMRLKCTQIIFGPGPCRERL